MAAETITSTTMTRQEPELYIRANISQNAKGEYRTDTTVSVSARAPIEEVRDLLRELLHVADTEARQEIDRRHRIDREIPA